MNRFSKLAAVLAAMPIMAISGTALADSPGQLTSGSSTYVVKNLTQKGAYDNNISAACNEEVQYAVRLHNAAFGGLTNVKVSANLVSGKMTAVPAEGASQGTTGSVTVNLPSNGSLAYESGTSNLYDANSNLIKSLPDGITTVGVNVGNISGSTTEFVVFKAKVACPPVTPPQAKLVCSALDVTQIDRTRYDFTVTGTAENTTITNYTFTVKNSAGTVIDTQTGSSNIYHFNQSTAGTYTVSSAVGNGSLAATSASCSKQITVAAAPTAVQSTTTTLPNTGPGDMLGLFAGASTLGAAAHLAYRRFRR